MSDQQRLAILDASLNQAFALIPDDDAEGPWNMLGGPEAFDRLQAGYQELAHAMFAYHRKWRPWRSRELRGLQNLTWLPTAFRDQVTELVAPAGHDFNAYRRRAAALRAAFNELIATLQQDGTYGDDPDNESFLRIYDEPGRAWNMDDWNAEHTRQHGS